MYKVPGIVLRPVSLRERQASAAQAFDPLSSSPGLTVMSYSDRLRGAGRGFEPRAVYPIVFIGFALFSNFARGAHPPTDVASSIPSEIDGLDRREQSGGKGTIDESVWLHSGYPVRTRLEIKSGAGEWRDEAPLLARFRRADKATVTQDGSSSDYMSTYYARRKAIMDKYDSQRKEISGRLERTKSLIAAKQRLRESKAKVQPGSEDATQVRGRDTLLPSVPRRDDPEPNSTTADPDPSRPFDFEVVENDPSSGHLRPEPPTLDAINGTTAPISPEGWTTPPPHDATDAFALENSTEPNAPSGIHTTVTPLPNNNTGTDGRPDDITEVNFPPRDRVDVNFTEESPAFHGRDNETLIIDLGGRLTDHHPWRNDSASAELDRMFLWDAGRGAERLDRSNGTLAQTRDEDPLESANAVDADDRAGHADDPSTADGLSVRVESSPGSHLTKSVKNVQSSTTTYRNLTHEIVEVDGVIASVNRIDGAPLAGVGPQTADANATNATTSAPGGVFGGARESEWCEECPHDYRWGECEGTLFYQHNIFLRNRGPSAIDAVFGMEVEGPVDVTCVEALRFNRTRGIVSLHSGGPGHDFAKLRIRGFQGEGFSYIMKVWGVNSEDSASSTSHPWK